MDILLNFAKGQTGIFLGFAGIAITYLVAAIFDNPTRRRDRFVKRAFFVAAAVFFILALLSWLTGTETLIDAGIVLAYLGIGVGLLCTAWTIRSHVKSAWVIFTIGMAFELIGFVLEIHAGLI